MSKNNFTGTAAEELQIRESKHQHTWDTVIEWERGGRNSKSGLWTLFSDADVRATRIMCSGCKKVMYMTPDKLLDIEETEA